MGGEMSRCQKPPSFLENMSPGVKAANQHLFHPTKPEGAEGRSIPVQTADSGRTAGKNVGSGPEMGFVRLTLNGQIRGGKNNMGVTKSGIHFPRRNWAIWRDDMLRQVREQIPTPPRLDLPLKCIIRYWAGDRKRRDVPAILDAIWHVLERSEVVADDSLIKSVEFHGAYNKEDPRADIILLRLTSE
jgi:Holliday junction resolvase RusA-like endonuclease